MKVLVCTISDRAWGGVYEDLSGPAAEEALLAIIPEASVIRHIVPDEPECILRAFVAFNTVDIILTTGGTGIGARDTTPEVTEQYCDKLLPGIAEYLRAESIKQTPHALFSRGVAGVKGQTAIINMPGSPRAAAFCTSLLAPVFAHLIKMMHNESH